MKQQAKQWLRFLGIGLLILILSIIVVQLITPYITNEQDESVNRTQALIDGPETVEIICRDERGVTHVLSCKSSTGVTGIWVLNEKRNGKIGNGMVSRFRMSEWEVNVGSNVSPDVFIVFHPKGSNDLIQFEYRMDTEYMREGISNFTGPQA